MISIVIPAYNEAQVIAKTLQSLQSQDFSGEFEVIVVDNNSTDKTAEVVRQFQDKLNLKVIYEPQRGRGAARATGFAAAQGEIICSTDADTIVPSNWLTKITAPFIKSDIIAVSGTSKITDGTVMQNIIFNWLQPLLSHLFTWRHGHIWLTGCNSAVKKQVYEQCGGYRQDLQALEDVEIAERLSEHGQILLVTNIPVITNARRFKDGLVQGLLHYVKAYTNMYIVKTGQAHLSDIR